MSATNEGLTRDRHRSGEPSGTSAFNNARNTQITHSSLTFINTTERCHGGPSDSLKTLYDRVAPNAILNAGGRADEVRCYPGTREEVIDLTERWMDDPDGANLMWLSGPAGAGKSAIVQTIAERCEEKGVQAVNFFFFRSDSTRNTARPLVATLLHQIFKFYPAAQQTIAALLSQDRLMFNLSVQDQFKRLLSSPLQDVPQPPESRTRRPIVLLIDGLDECDSDNTSSQKQIIQALERLVSQEGSPFLALVASRAEPHLTMAFKRLSSSVKSIFLNEEYQPEKDIRLFVIAEFGEIKDSHHLAYTLASDWPSDEDVEAIVQKSSGQFIFAATVMRFLASSSASPKLSLEIVQGIVPIDTNTPFAHLDAIYTYIFSRVRDREAVLALLAMQLLDNADLDVVNQNLKSILHAYNPRYTPEFLLSCIADLTPIMQFDGGAIKFFHASLPDFLQDQSRAGEYFIDILAFGVKILPIVWMMTPESMAETFFGHSLLQELTTPTPDTTKLLLTQLHPHANLDYFSVTPDLYINEIFKLIYKLYYPHDEETYKKILHHWVFWCTSLPQSEATNIREETRSLPYMAKYIKMASKQESRVSKALKSFRIMK